MRPCADFDKIVNKQGKLLGVLNYNLMIPVTEKQIIRLSLKNQSTDSPSEKYYKQLCIDEINRCRKHSNIIINKVLCLYHLCTTETNYKGKGRCLDFKKLELACDKYNSKYP